MIQIHLPSFLETTTVGSPNSHANIKRRLSPSVPPRQASRTPRTGPTASRTRHALAVRNAPRMKKKKGTASQWPVAPYLTGTSFSSGRIVCQIPGEIAFGGARSRPLRDHLGPLGPTFRRNASASSTAPVSLGGQGRSWALRDDDLNFRNRV